MTLARIKRNTERLQNQLTELIDKREIKLSDRSPRWQRSKTGREFSDENRILSELFEAVANFNTVINQPFDEEE